MHDDEWLRPSEPPREPSFNVSARQLAFMLVLVSMTVLFGAGLLAFAVTRAHADLWRPADTPPLPLGLLFSTMLLLGVSLSAQKSLWAIRANRSDAATRLLWLTGVFASAFLVGQALNWVAISSGFAQGEPRTLYEFTFFLLTGLHAAHVLGGFVPLGIVLRQSHKRAYSSSRHEGLKLCAHYWHFLGLVWVVLLLALWVGS
jgi:cytochrome c oxidase subunit 3